MSKIYDYAVIGGGLSGSTIAYALTGHGSVVLIDDSAEYSGSSIPAGLFNPIMSRQATRVWMASEALEILSDLLGQFPNKNIQLKKGVVRPAQSEKQAQAFLNSANQNGDLCSWLEAGDSSEQFTNVKAPFGSLFIHSGGAVNIPGYCHSLRSVAHLNGMDQITGVAEAIESSSSFASITLSDANETDIVQAAKVIVCSGAGYGKLDQLSDLRLHKIKGQVVTLEKPQDYGEIPSMSGSGYAIDVGAVIVVGSSYEHAYDDEAPTRSTSLEVLRKAANMLPGVDEFRIVNEHTGIRVTVPRSYLPMVGTVDSDSRIWFAGGLGSKGLLMSAWISANVHDFLTGERKIPEPLAIKWVS